MKFETAAIHAGQDPDPTTGSVVVPIYATSTYAQPAPGEHRGYEYSRTGNPTRHALEVAVAALEGVTENDPGGALATASGMAATALLGYTLSPGDHVLLPDDAYGGTFRFFTRVLTGQGVEWSSVDMTSSRLVATAIRPNTRLIWTETPTNPMLRLVDIAAVAEVASAAGATFVVDNTFATPYLQQPLDLGADVVLHSSTKYLGGHSDVVGGVLVTRHPELFEQLAFLSNAAGPVAGPFDAWLVLRGLKTLAVRMERHISNARALAEYLAGHRAVEQVIYPGLESHPQHSLAVNQMGLGGGMVSFRPSGGPARAREITKATRFFFLAESLGGVESLIELPAVMTHASVEGTPFAVPNDLIRLSVGIEHVDDLIEDLEAALS